MNLFHLHDAFAAFSKSDTQPSDINHKNIMPGNDVCLTNADTKGSELFQGSIPQNLMSFLSDAHIIIAISVH